MGLLAAAAVAAIQVTPSILQYLNLAQLSADISDADLAAIKSHENADVVQLGAAIEAAKAA